MQFEMEQEKLKTMRTRLTDSEHEKDILAMRVSTSHLSLPMHSPQFKIDSVIFAQFEAFRAQAVKSRWLSINTLPYIKSAYNDDVTPCLNFTSDVKIGHKKFLETIMDQSGFIEIYDPALTLDTRPPPTHCSTCAQVPPTHRYKIPDMETDLFTLICTSCKMRLDAVVNFYGFVRNMRQGMYNHRANRELFFETIKLRRAMFYARLGTTDEEEDAKKDEK